MLGLESILHLAEKYSILLTHVPSGADMLNSPSGTAGLDLPSRTVFVSPSAKFEHVLHEIAHIVTAPPGVDYEDVPEDYFLLQLERCWAQGLRLSQGLTKAILTWQGGTAVPLLCEEKYAMLDEVAEYERSSPWRAGFRRLRALDLIDSSNRPTFRSPTWTEEALAELVRAVARGRH
jgi:hypothetical protein